MFFNQIEFDISADDLSIEKMKTNLLDMQIKADNERQGSLKYYDCPICKNKGQVYIKTENGTEAVKDCECKAIRESYRLIATSGLQSELQSKTFDNYICKYPFQQEAKEKAERFISDSSYTFFYIGGQSGAGKTHLCTAIAGKLLSNGLTLKYFKWATDAAYIISLSANEDRERKEKALNNIIQTPVLYIDDFLRNRPPTQAEIKLAFCIIDARYREGMCTIISSEKTLNELYKIDEAIAGRICERVKRTEYYVKIPKEIKYNFRAYAV